MASAPAMASFATAGFLEHGLPDMFSLEGHGAFVFPLSDSQTSQLVGVANTGASFVLLERGSDKERKALRVAQWLAARR